MFLEHHVNRWTPIAWIMPNFHIVYWMFKRKHFVVFEKVVNALCADKDQDKRSEQNKRFSEEKTRS
jgi:hypothetical protein